MDEGPRGVYAGPAQPQPGRQQPGHGVGSWVPRVGTKLLWEGGAWGLQEI